MELDFQTQMLVAATTESVKQPVQIIINSWLKPKIEKYFAKRKLDNNLAEITSDLFLDYLSRSYEQNKSISILAIGNQQVHIDEVYQPLTIKKGEFNRIEKYKVEAFPEELASKYKRILIEDQAGMGKSTLMKKMFVSAIENNLGIPVFLELRKLNSGINILDYIIDTVNSINEEYNKNYDKELLFELIKRGDFLFFLDGYDEISFNIKNEVTENLKSFISKTSNNIFFLTSRPDQSLSSFSEFQTFEINNLNKEEAYSLFQKYDYKTGYDIATSLTNQIIDSLESGSFKDLVSFLGNPLLVSFIYITYKHKRNIPSNKDDFYRKVYDALYEDHDYSKDGFNRGKYCKLSKEKFHKFLRKLGFLCLIENKNDYSKDKLVSLIDEAKDTSYVGEVDSSDIFQDLMETVPLFARDGLSFKWAHKSFMEYFSACYIFMDKAQHKDEILQQMFNSDNFDIYENLLNIYYDLDQETFDKILLLPVFIDFLDYMGDIKKLTKNQLTLKSLLYNQIFYLETNTKLHVFRGEDSSSKEDLERKIFEEISIEINSQEKLFNLGILLRYKNYNENRDTFVCEAILSPKPNYIKSLKILLKKDSPIISKITDHAYKHYRKSRIISCYDDTSIMESRRVKANIEFVLNFVLQDRFYLNIEEVRKYKRRIDEHLKLKESDIVQIL